MMQMPSSRAERRREQRDENNKQEKEERARERERRSHKQRRRRDNSVLTKINRERLSLVLASILPLAIVVSLQGHYIMPHIFDARRVEILKVVFDNTGELFLLSGSTFLLLWLLEQVRQQMSNSTPIGSERLLEALGIGMAYTGAATVLDTENIVILVAVLISAASVTLKWSTMLNWRWPETLIGWLKLALLLDVIYLVLVLIISNTITGIALVAWFGTGVLDVLWTLTVIAITVLLGLFVFIVGLIYYPKIKF